MITFVLALFSRLVQRLRLTDVRALRYTLFWGTCSTPIRRDRCVTDPWSVGQSFIRYLVPDWTSASRFRHARLRESCECCIKDSKGIFSVDLNAHRSQDVPYLEDADWPSVQCQNSHAKPGDTFGHFFIGFRGAQRFQDRLRSLQFFNSFPDESLLLDAIGELGSYGIHRPMVRVAERVGHVVHHRSERARKQVPSFLVPRQAPTYNQRAV